ncbi:MAG: glutamate--tRNA ligase [Myxococcales bacterium]|nr:MAG: glutamate--tRNA ligase [Myxococcales bacterium]
MSKTSEIRVRIAPSPTGDPHVGTAYVALFNFAFARKNKGKFILRIEDTDRARSTRKSEDEILAALKWLGLDWDEGPDVGGPNGPYRQSERSHIYKSYAQKLVDNGAAYKCICTGERLAELRKRQQILKQPTGYDGHCRKQNPQIIEQAIQEGTPFVVRLKTPLEGQMHMQDALRGEIVINCTEVDDQVLVKSDGFPTYHLANVIDDHLMGITHVIRGEEWISSLPKHILLYEALGFEKPQFCHLPLLRNADKSKVSKRKNPVSLHYFKEAGYLPDAMLNFLGLMAYSSQENEIFSLTEFVENFDLQKIVLGGPVFDVKKLLWLNGRYLRELRSEDQIVTYLQEQLFSSEYLSKIVPLVKERVEKSEDFIEYADFFFKADVAVAKEHYLIGELEAKSSALVIEQTLEVLENLKEFSSESISGALKNFLKEQSMPAKNLFMPLRMMVSGKKASPPLFDTMAVLGKERCRTRLRAAINALKK